jgi:hypothetical protein
MTAITADTPCTECGERLGYSMAKRRKTRHLPEGTCPKSPANGKPVMADVAVQLPLPKTTTEEEPVPTLVETNGHKPSGMRVPTAEMRMEAFEKAFSDITSTWYGKRNQYEGKAEVEEPDPSSWQPVNLTPVLDGTWQPPKPSVGGACRWQVPVLPRQDTHRHQ